jgi:DNA-binding transcriptional LysR family regulator
MRAVIAFFPLITAVIRHRGQHFVARSSQFGLMLELVAAGIGVARNRRHAGVKSLRVTGPALKWRLALSWRSGGYISQAATAWLALAKEIERQPAIAGAPRSRAAASRL